MEIEDKKIKFCGNRYVTELYEEKIPEQLQQKLWCMLEETKTIAERLDWVQVFLLKRKISDEGNIQLIEHIMDVEPYSIKSEIPLDEPLEDTIFIVSTKNRSVDGQDRIIAMMGSEYWKEPFIEEGDGGNLIEKESGCGKYKNV